jgi:hypothetical protein
VLSLGRRFVKEHFLGCFAVLRLLNLCFSFVGCSSRDDLCCPELNSGIVRVSRLLQFSAPGDLGSNNWDTSSLSRINGRHLRLGYGLEKQKDCWSCFLLDALPCIF